MPLLNGEVHVIHLVNAASNDRREVAGAMRAQATKLGLVEDILGVIADLAKRAG
jgi:hypothetical protein